MLRVLFLMAIFFAAADCRVQAAPLELCPAQAKSAVPVHHVRDNVEGVKDTAFGLQLFGLSRRSVSGTLTVLSAGKLYSVPFSNAALTPVTHHAMRGNTQVYEYGDFESPPVFFSLPAESAVDAVWVSSVAADAGAQLTCPPLPAAAKESKDPLPLHYTGGLTVDEFLALAPASAPPATFISDAPVQGCDHVFAYAKGVDLATPVYPDTARDQGFLGAVMLIRIVLDDRGSVRDASMLAPSGNAMVDQSALRAARISTYAPTQLMCKPVPGVYSIRSTFNP